MQKVFIKAIVFTSMERRSLIKTSFAVLFVSPGCMDQEASNSTPTKTDASVDQFEKCDASFVIYRMILGNLTREIDLAFEKDELGTQDELLYPKAVSEDTKLWREGKFYEHNYSTSGDVNRLSFQEWDSFEYKQSIFITNERDNEIDVKIVVKDSSSEEIFQEDNVSVGSEDRERLQITEEFGSYSVEVELSGGEIESGEWPIGYPDMDKRARSLDIYMQDDGIKFEKHIEQLDYIECSWYE